MKKIFLFLVPLLGLLSCDVEETPKPAYVDGEGIPIPTHFFVSDFTGKMLDSTQRTALEKKLQHYQDSTTTQVVIICLPTMPKNKNGYTWELEDLSLQIGRQWGIGQKDTNNGVLLLFVLDDHKIRIETGYGAEGALPDVTCKRIIDKDITPEFKNEKYYTGMDKSTTSIFRALAGEYEAIAEKEDIDEKNAWAILIGIGICAIIGLFLIWVASALGGIYIGIFWSVVYSVTFWHALLAAIIGAAVTLVVSFFARLFLSGSPDGFSSGGEWSSSGSSSGGFSGGGGSFGGGGASGSW